MPRSPGFLDFPVGLGLLWRTTWLTFLMTVTWEAANGFFDVFITTVVDISDISHR